MPDARGERRENFQCPLIVGGQRRRESFRRQSHALHDAEIVEPRGGQRLEPTCIEVRPDRLRVAGKTAHARTVEYFLQRGGSRLIVHVDTC